MAAMNLAVGVAYREIYSWKTAILYRHFVCQGTPSFVALEKTGFFEESARAAYTSGKASSEFMLHVLVYLVTFLQVSWCTLLWFPSPCWHCYSWSCPPKNLNYIHDCFYTLLGSHIRAGAKRIDQLLASCAALCLYLVLCHTVL